MKYENGKIIIDVNSDVGDDFVLESLKLCYHHAASDFLTHPDDIVYNSKLKKALKRVIRHYSTHEAYNKWMDEICG